MRLAVAGSSGLASNAHFGRAEYFDIFEFGPDLVPTFLERRFCSPTCEVPDASWQLADTVALLADCVAVLASQIGPCAQRELADNQIRAIEHAGPRLNGTDAILAALI